MTENDITYIVRGKIIYIYKALGPGLFESVYKKVLRYELEKNGLYVREEVILPLLYNNQSFDIGFKIDLLVNEKVIVELKATNNFTETHHKQILTYLRLSKLKLGILVNFNTDNIYESIFRKVNNLY